MACIAYRDQELEESFSFSSCYDFNSSSFQSIFSDESDDESYIEIALEQKNYHGDIDDWADEEMELRISFSSSVPFQEPSTTTTSIENESAATMSKSPSASSTTTTFTMNSSSPSKEGDQWDTQMGSKASNSNCRIQKTIKRKAQFPKVHGFLNMLKPSLTVSSEASDENGRPASSNHLELVRPSTMKGSKETAMNSSGIVMKFLVKFRTLRIRTLLASFMKSRQEINFPRGKKNIGAYQTLIKPFDKWLVRKGQGSSSNSNNPFGNGDRSRVMEKNLDAIRGVLEAMSTSVGGKDRKSKSCPSSTKSSPTHLGFSSGDQNHKICAQDNSIQAAIAHCKRSFGPNIV
ncbi:hypothetical protein POPTR_016G141900v4 [Populus trichocarpa]|uniref:Uncharacterized protein n=1 Tax=Populus trichocarpa TaxID=3694 RepID=A0ACC0RTT5_POPTR|nr:suppressor protein SRP40 [Populus trichocarpa]KAI9380720.1 hypothetical protein POPTR_016G141900v4 [Populus trichocarpa]